MSYINNLHVLARHQRGEDFKNIAPAVAAALIAGGASLIGGLFSAGSSAYQASQGRAFSNDQMKFMAAHDKEMLSLEEAYNNKITDPSYQKANYEAAGINPSLVMGNGVSIGSASGNSSVSGSQPPVADYTPAIDMARQGIQGGVDTYLRAKQVEQDNVLKREQSELLRQQGINQQIRNQFQTMELQRELEVMSAELENYKASASLSKKSSSRIDKEIDILDQQQKRLVATFNDDILTPKIQNESTLAATAYTNAKTATETLLRIPQLREIVQRTKNYQASSAAMYASVAEASERIEQLKKSGKLTDASIDKVSAEAAKTWLEAVGVDNNNKNYNLFLERTKAEIKKMNRLHIGEWNPDDPFGMKESWESRPSSATSSW